MLLLRILPTTLAPSRTRVPSGARAYLAELFGTFLLVFIGPGVLVLASTSPSLSAGEALVVVALAFGLTVGSVIALIGRHSGAHINPAITLANTVAGVSHRREAIPYVVFQLVGALLAGLSLKLVFADGGGSASLGATKLAAGVSVTEGFALEVAGTFVLAAAALTAGAKLSEPWKQGVLVGCTLTVLILLVGPFTGASFNPARSLGPSVFTGYFSDQPLYWFGPLLGGGLAGLVFAALRRGGIIA